MANFKKTMTGDEFKKAFVEHLKDNNLYNAFKSGLKLKFTIPLDYSTLCNEVARKGHIVLNTGEEFDISSEGEDDITLELAGKYCDSKEGLTNFALKVSKLSQYVVENINPQQGDWDLTHKVINSNLKKRVDEFANIYKIKLDFEDLNEYTFVYKAYPELEPQLFYDKEHVLQSVDKEHVLTLIEENLKEEDYDM